MLAQPPGVETGAGLIIMIIIIIKMIIDVKLIIAMGPTKLDVPIQTKNRMGTSRFKYVHTRFLIGVFFSSMFSLSRE